jgi:hypothetical protein
MTAASFAFFTWPENGVQVFYDQRRTLSRRLKGFFDAWDLDGIFKWLPEDYRDTAAQGAALTIVLDDKVYSGFRAVRMMFLLNPITYLVIAGSIAAFGDLVGNQAVFCRRLIVLLSLVLLMPPLAWLADKLTEGHKAPVATSRLAPAGSRATRAGKQ